MPATIDALTTAKTALKGVKLSLDTNATNLQTINDPNAVSQKVIASTTDLGRVRYDVREVVDESLLKKARTTLVIQKELQTKLDSLESLEVLMGEKNDATSFAHLGSNISESLHTLATASRDGFPGAKLQTFTDINNFITSLQTFSGGVQRVRKQADEHISSHLESVNALLQDIGRYNIKALTARDGDFRAIEGQRSSLNELAKHVGFYVQESSDGSLKVYSDIGGKYTLVDGSRVAKFKYDPPATVDATTTFNEITLEYSGFIVKAPLAADGHDLTNYLATLNGPLSSNLYLRDTLTPSLQDQMNKVSANTYVTFNELHNQGTSTALRSIIASEGIPGSLTLDGTEDLDPTKMTGVVRFALMNTASTLNSHDDYRDIDLARFLNDGEGATLNDFVVFLNEKFSAGPALGITASIINNQLTLTSSDPSLGIVIGEDPNNPTNMELSGSSSGLPISEFFGFNNLFSAGVDINHKDFVNQIRVRRDIFDNQGDGLAVGRLRMDTLTTKTAIIVGANIAEELADSWKNQKIQFSGTSTLGARESTLHEYVQTIVINHAERVVSLRSVCEVATQEHERASIYAAKASKIDREELESELAELTVFQASIIRLLQISFAMMQAINDLASK